MDFDTGGVNPPEADKLFEDLAVRALEFSRRVRPP